MKNIYTILLGFFTLLFGVNYAFIVSNGTYEELHIIGLVLSAILVSFFYRRR